MQTERANKRFENGCSLAPAEPKRYPNDMNEELDPQTEVPQSFWAFIDQIQCDPTAMQNTLAEMDQDRLVLNFLVYVQLRADLADAIVNLGGCSEDTAEDVADGIIASGRDAYVEASTVGLPSREKWAGIEGRGLLHIFDTVYYDRFGDAIWDETDALEDDYLPWDPRSG